MQTHTKPQNNNQDCISKVNLLDYIKMEWKSDKRVVASVRVNSDLYKEFKTVSKQLYGSTCRAGEFFMASVVLATRNKVNFSHTQQPIVFGHVTIERNIKTRRKLIVEEETEIETVMDSKTCFYCDCVPVWKCVTVFKINPVKSICQKHLGLMERRNEVVSRKRIEVS